MKKLFTTIATFALMATMAFADRDLMENLDLLEQTKQAIGEAIEEKGGTLPTNFLGYAQAIRDLPSGGGSNEVFKAVVSRQATPFDVPASALAGATTIGDYAFGGCEGLRSIGIPPSITYIDKNAFGGSPNITRVNISDLDAWCRILFTDRNSNPIKTDTNLYLNGNLVTNVVFPNDLTKIKAYVFYDYTPLTSITIPDSVTSIGNYAFKGCSGLRSVTIGKNLFEIATHAFSGCSLMSIAVSPDNANYSSLNGLLLNKEKTAVVLGIGGDVTIPDSVIAVDNAFAQNKNLLSITNCPILHSLYNTPPFSGCTSLHTIALRDTYTLTNLFVDPGSVYTRAIWQGNSAVVQLADGTRLDHIVVPASVPKIGKHCLYNYNGVESITFEPNSSCTNFDEGCLQGCTNLTSVTIPDSVTTIAGWAFQNSSSLELVDFGSTRTTIPTLSNYNAFTGTSAALKIVVPDALVETWKAANRWSYWSSNIIGQSEYQASLQ